MPRHNEQFTLADGRPVTVTYDTPCPPGCTCPLHDDPTDMQARDFTPEHRAKLAKTKQALPDGSFPIVTAGDLHNAVRAIGRAKNPAAAKAHIKRRAEALGLTSALPDDWQHADAADPEPDTDPDDAVETDPSVLDENLNTPGELLSFAAEAEGVGRIYASDLAHPNCAPFKAVLHQVDQASDRPPNGAQGHRVLIPRHVAERRVSTLVNMGLNAQSDLEGHQVTKKIGVIKAAAVGRDPDPKTIVPGFKPDANAVMVSGCLYAKDFPREVAAIRAAAARGTLGTSYEVANASVRNPDAPVWVLDDLIYTGAAALSRDAAAYQATQLAAEHDSQGGSPMALPNQTPPSTTPHPAPTPALAPAPTTDPMEEKINAAITAALGSFRSEVAARMQALEGAVASLSTRPGERPEEMAQREQAQAMDEQARALEPKILQTKEEASALRSEGKPAEADQKDNDADDVAAQAATLRASAVQLRAKAFGYAPVIQAMAGLVTDAVAPIGKQVTEMGAQVKATLAKLVTDKSGPGGGPGQGGPEPTPAQPERRSMSASSTRFLAKFPEADAKGITEDALTSALIDAGLSSEQRIAAKNEFSRAGLLRH